MTEKPKRERPNTIAYFVPPPDTSGRSPPRLPEPLLLFGEKDELRINPKHWAAWPARLLYALLVPLLILMNVASIAHSWWRSRKERAYLRSKGLVHRRKRG